jgi:hypothetical protein
MSIDLIHQSQTLNTLSNNSSLKNIIHINGNKFVLIPHFGGDIDLRKLFLFPRNQGHNSEKETHPNS